MMEKVYINRRFKGFRTWLLLFVLCLMTSAVSASSSIDTKSVTSVSLVMGELVTLQTYDLTRVSVANPEIADINSADDKSVVIVAKTVGQTALFLWDEFGRRTIMLQVNSQDLIMIQERIETLLSAVDIEGISVSINEQEGKVVCSGEIENDQLKAFNKIIEPFREDIILFIDQTKIEDLVLIDAQVTELFQTLASNLGVDWQASNHTTLALDYNEILPDFDGSVADYFKIGDMERVSGLVAIINMMVEEGEARILSKPKLLVKSGEEASFFVGGEIPIIVVTRDDGETTESVEYKEYGLSMSITPVVTNDGKIDMGVDLQITEINEALSTSDNYGFTKRNTATQLLLDDEQTVVIAGLIKNRDVKAVKKVPYLSALPLLGGLFKNTVVPRNEDQELVVALTPKIKPQKIIEKKSSSAKDNSKKSITEQAKEITEQENQRSQSVQEIKQQDNDFSQQERPVVIPSYMSALEEEEKSEQRKDELATVYHGIPREMSAYVYDVQKKIFDSIKFPSDAKQHGWEGVVKLELLILDDGTLAFVLVDDSSGYEAFDENAVQTARKVAPFGAFPRETNLQELNLTIPIVYSLN